MFWTAFAFVMMLNLTYKFYFAGTSEICFFAVFWVIALIVCFVGNGAAALLSLFLSPDPAAAAGVLVSLFALSPIATRISPLLVIKILAFLPGTWKRGLERLASERLTSPRALNGYVNSRALLWAAWEQWTPWKDPFQTRDFLMTLRRFEGHSFLREDPLHNCECPPPWTGTLNPPSASVLSTILAGCKHLIGFNNSEEHQRLIRHIWAADGLLGGSGRLAALVQQDSLLFLTHGIAAEAERVLRYGASINVFFASRVSNMLEAIKILLSQRGTADELAHWPALPRLADLTQGPAFAAHNVCPDWLKDDALAVVVRIDRGLHPPTPAQ